MSSYRISPTSVSGEGVKKMYQAALELDLDPDFFMVAAASVAASWIVDDSAKGIICDRQNLIANIQRFAADLRRD